MHTPVLIIGSGLAGLSTAYRLAQQGIKCTVVTKDEVPVKGTNSEYAQGGIIYKSKEGDPESLIEDILSAGDRINAQDAVEQLSKRGTDLVKEILIDQVQVPFDRHGDDYSLTKEAAHTHPRILHVKDYTGKSIMDSLWRKIESHPNVSVLTGHILVDLLTSGHNCRGYRFKYKKNRCLGAYLFNIETGEVLTQLAEYTVLCTGGVGQSYEYHTNAQHAYGSGLSVANRARVRIINARFVQFHPTALWSPKKGRRFLISEALRGEGARLMNKKGEYIMDSHPQKDLESRAVVSRVIMEELQKSGEEYVYLNLFKHYSGSQSIVERFPSISEACKKEGIDISKDPIPVIPAEHFFCGGIAVDLHGQSELEGLFAAGEVACSGVHGANRLASSSLLECLTWGVSAADQLVQNIQNVDDDLSLTEAFDLVDDWESFGVEICDPVKIESVKERIRVLMWDSVGILRNKEELLIAKDKLREIWKEIDQDYSSYALSEALIELRHMIETAYLITLSASSHTSLKEDSIGGHVLVSGEE
jgi:L-aspartate oxidase